MKIKKIAQGLIKGLILNKKSDSIADTYSCDYINKQNSYSTEEQVIGTWIDGKPLYRRTYIINAANDLYTGISDLDNLIEFKTQVKTLTDGSGQWREFPWLWVTGASYGSAIHCGGAYYETNGNFIRFQFGSDIIDKLQKIIIILKYTKTTD